MSKDRPSIGDRYVVGLDIQKFSDYYGQSVSQFFGRLSSYSVYLGGSPNLSNTFLGKIYKAGFSTQKNLSKISSAFSLDGTTKLEDLIGQQVSSYDISAQSDLEGFGICVGSDASWEDYVPLSYFAKNVQDSRGDERLDLDFIQFNVNYPAPSKFVQESEPGEWSYEELRSEYSNPIQRQYDSLDNYLSSGFDNYEDLKNRARNTYKYDTSGSIVKTYVTFQLLEDGANRQSSTYSQIELAPKDGILTPGDSWLNTKYEVCLLYTSPSPRDRG